MSDPITMAPTTTTPARPDRSGCPPAAAAILVGCGVDAKRIECEWMDILILAEATLRVREDFLRYTG